MMQTSHEIRSAVADDDHRNASEVVNSVNESTNEVKGSEKNTRHSDLSLNIPTKHVHFVTPGSSPNSRISPWRIFRGLSFKMKSVPDDQSSSLLHPAVQPESPLATKFMSIFKGNRCTSLPVKSATTPVSARTYSEQQKTQIRVEKHSVTRSLSVPSRNIVIVRSLAFAAHKDNDQIDSSNDEIRPVRVSDDEEIDEEEAVCRICFDACDKGNQLKMKCSCKGALKLVHEECAVKWFNFKGNKNCDVCGREVSNLPVTLFRMSGCVQRQNRNAQNQQGLDSRTISAWQDIVRLVLISTICYFFLIEQLLINDLKTQAVTIAAPFSFTFGLLSSILAVILALEEHIWRYAVLEFTLVAMILHSFYSWLHLKAIYAVMASSVMGFGLAMTLNALYIRYVVWRDQTSPEHNNI